MFDVGFWELLFVGLVALLVVGPERLPKLARTVGLWVGKTRRFVSSVKADIDRELKAEELKQILEKQKRSNPLEEIIEDTSGALGQIKEDAASVLKDGERSEGSASESNRQSNDSK
jgi:sec-independent protein translocase protein TatB